MSDLERAQRVAAALVRAQEEPRWQNPSLSAVEKAFEDRHLLAAELGRVLMAKSPDWTAVRAAISNAYYAARNDGATMEHAADIATAAVMEMLTGGAS